MDVELALNENGHRGNRAEGKKGSLWSLGGFSHLCQGRRRASGFAILIFENVTGNERLPRECENGCLALTRIPRGSLKN
jgi:hypothetical protein